MKSNTKLPALILTLVLSLIPSMVLAHSALVKSEPGDGEILATSPSQVKAWFGEELDAQSSELQVFDSQNNQVDMADGGVDLNDLDHLSMFVSLPELSTGSYNVQWTAVSAEDGDSTVGSFMFSVRDASTTQVDISTNSAENILTSIVVVAVTLIGFVAMVRVRTNIRNSST